MPSRRPITRAARDLADRLAADGVTAREIERWQQEYGLIEPPTQPTRDGYKAYSRDAESQARDVKRLLDGGRGLTLHQIVIAQFVRGHYVATERLKRELLTAIRQTLAAEAPTGSWDTVLPLADAQAQRYTSVIKRDPEAKDLRHSLRKSGPRPGETKTDTIHRLLTSAILAAMAGEPKTRSDLRELLAALGLDTDGVNLDATANGLPQVSQQRLEQAVIDASRAQLDQAASDCRQVLHILQTHNLVTPSDHEAVLLATGLLSVRNWIGDELNWVLDTLNKM